MRKLLALVLAASLGVAVAVGAKRLLKDAPPSPPPPSTPLPVNSDGYTLPERAAPVASAPAAPSVGRGHFHQDETPERPLWLRGYVVRGPRFNALLSDGRTLTEMDNEVSTVERHGIRLKDGRFVGFRTLSRPIPASGGSGAAESEKPAEKGTARPESGLAADRLGTAQPDLTVPLLPF